MFDFAAYGETIKNNLETQDDSILIQEIENFIVMMVSDGNGSSPGMINIGSLANSILFDYLKSIMYNATITSLVNQIGFGMVMVQKCFLSINAIDEKYKNIYATQSVVIIDNQSLDACFASLGNCEIQLWRNHQFTRMNTLQSVAYEKLMKGEIVESDFYNCADRGVLTSAYGVYPNIKPFIQKGKLIANDILLLTTDGIYAAMNPNDVVDLMGQGDTPQGAVKKILEATNLKGAFDNAGMICCFIMENNQ